MHGHTRRWRCRQAGKQTHTNIQTSQHRVPNTICLSSRRVVLQVFLAAGSDVALQISARPHTHLPKGKLDATSSCTVDWCMMDWRPCAASPGTSNHCIYRAGAYVCRGTPSRDVTPNAFTRVCARHCQCHLHCPIYIMHRQLAQATSLYSYGYIDRRKTKRDSRTCLSPALVVSLCVECGCIASARTSLKTSWVFQRCTNEVDINTCCSNVVVSVCKRQNYLLRLSKPRYAVEPGSK